MIRIVWPGVVGALIGAGAATAAILVGVSGLPAASSVVPDSVVATIEAAEGFRGEPYDDSRGFSTIGYGTKLPITRAEGELLLRHRLAGIVDCIEAGWGGWDGAPEAAQRAIADAGYQLGCGGVLGFHDALAALQRHDYDAAAAALRDSDWFRETPERVERVIATLEGK